MSRINLDMDVLRTLVMAQRLGGFGRAAEQVGRSQSAVSQQIHKLEERVGQPLFRKHGRGLELTEAGETVLSYARRILELNDEAVTAVRGAAIDGVVRFGLAGDFAEAGLPDALGRFARAHPSVRVEATVERNLTLLERLERGQLDLVLTLGHGDRPGAERIGTLPLVWIGRADVPPRPSKDEPVALAMFEGQCFCRAVAIDALDAAEIPWRVVFTSPSLHGLWAAVGAGLAVTVRTRLGVPPVLTVMGKESGLPALGRTDFSMHGGAAGASPAVARFKEIMVEIAAERLAAVSGAKLE